MPTQTERKCLRSDVPDFEMHVEAVIMNGEALPRFIGVGCVMACMRKAEFCLAAVLAQNSPFRLPALTMQIMRIPRRIGLECIVLAAEGKAVALHPVTEGNERITARGERIGVVRRCFAQQRYAHAAPLPPEAKHEAAARGKPRGQAAARELHHRHVQPLSSRSH